MSGGGGVGWGGGGGDGERGILGRIPYQIGSVPCPTDRGFRSASKKSPKNIKIWMSAFSYT
jgi:hypothetical protein